MQIQQQQTQQTTVPGTVVITVARDGADHDSHGNPIYCTAIYRAVARHRDGVLTWRRVGSYRDRTAGKRITGPMEARARARAEERGVEYYPYVRHGHVCP
jgi:hypothetical protein